MKLVSIALLVAGSCAFAQHGTALYPGTGTPPAPGFGGVLHPGGPARPAAGNSRFFAPPAIGHPGHSRAVIVPYPVFYGGYYGYYDPSTDAQQQPAPANSYGDTGSYGAPGQSPVVILNQSFQPETPNPVLRDYSNTPLPPTAANPGGRPDDQPTIYLIAMTDHTILPAVAYWVEGDTLAYITSEGDQNRVSLALVDREFSQKLNADRNVEFRLPAAK